MNPDRIAPSASDLIEADMAFGGVEVDEIGLGNGDIVVDAHAAAHLDYINMWDGAEAAADRRDELITAVNAELARRLA